MVNEQKVLQMTKMAVYESGEGRKDKAVSGYFRGDYIGLQMILSFLVITAAFAAVAAAYVCFNFEELMADIYTMDLVEMGRSVLGAYLAVLVVYLAVTYLVYAVRYNRARKRLDTLLDDLESLEEIDEEI